MKRMLKFVFSAILAACVVQGSGAYAADITEHSELKSEATTKIGSLLMIGTSSLNANRDLGNKQALIGAEVRKLIRASGVEVFPIGIRPDDTSPDSVIRQAISKHTPSHTMSITIPKGTVVVSRITKKQIAAKDYLVCVEVTDAKTDELVWEYFAEVNATFGASNAQVAEAIVARLRKDFLL